MFNYFPLLITIVLAYTPSFAWLVLVLSQDVHPEKATDIAKAFVLGSFLALPVILFSLWGNNVLDILLIDLPPVISKFIFGAFIEEVLKGAFIYWFAISTSRWSEPVDTFIYAATLALGFAGIENFAFVLSFTDNSIESMYQLLVLRSLTAVMIHIISSFIFTYGIVFYSKYKQIVRGICLMLLGIIFHGLWNLVIEISKFSGSIVIVMFYFLICIPLFIGLILLIKHLRIESSHHIP